MRKRILSTLLALSMALALLPGTAWADDSGKCGENVTWSVSENNTKLVISGSGDMYLFRDDWEDHLPWREYRSSINTVEIQEGVSNIGSLAFLNLINLTSIRLPNTVSSIGYSIFEGCIKLEDIDIPSSITTIPESAFSNCTALKTITLPNSIEGISGFAFSDCSSLTDIQIPDSVKTLGIMIFQRCSSLEKMVIPDSVTVIGGSLFEDCTSLKECIFPRSVEEMGNDMFTGCTSLEKVTLPETLEEIGFGFFQNCSALPAITVPATVSSISPFAFLGCTSFKDIYYAGTKEQWSKINVSDKGTPTQLYLSNPTTVHCSDGEITLDKNEWNPHNHSYRAIVTYPTCTEQGYTTYKCQCGDEYVSDYVPAAGHIFLLQVVREATETQPGLGQQICAVCGYEDEELVEIPWTGPGEHTHSYTATVTPPTCTEKGYTTYTCGCGETYHDNETPAIGHNYGRWVVMQEATEMHTGLRERVCSVCGNTQSETIPRLDPADVPDDILPFLPSRPTEPVNPTEPVTPAEPEPEQPAEPETPAQPEQPAVPAPVYADVAPDAWYCNAVQFVSANGFMTGTTETEFSPAAPMTRAMLWTVLGRLDGADVEGTGNNWYASAQLWAAGRGVSDGSNPGGSITRQELVTMLWRYVDNPAASADLAAFSDGPEVPDWASPAMQWAVSAGILEGSGGQLKPGGTATRAEVAVILMRFCENTAK